MCRDRKRRVTLISGAAHPDTINTVRTYCYGTGDELRVVPVKNGKTDMDALREMLTADVSGFYVQQPNFFGQLEDAEMLGEAVHQAGALYIMGCNPLALAIMKRLGTAARTSPWARASLWVCPWAAAARIWATWPLRIS